MRHLQRARTCARALTFICSLLVSPPSTRLQLVDGIVHRLFLGEPTALVPAAPSSMVTVLAAASVGAPADVNMRR